MKKMLLFVVVLLLSAAPIFGQETAPHQVTFDQFDFNYDPSLGSVLTVSIEAGNDPAVQQPGGPIPPHTLYAIYNGDSIDSVTWPRPDFAATTIRLYRVSDLQQYSFQAAQLARLQSLITEQPDLSAYTVMPDDASQIPPTLPMLDSIPASQVVLGRPQFMRAGSFSGITYLTAYRQDASPLLNDSFIYLFQGISDDGALAVSAWFNVTTTLFPENLPADFNYDNFVAGYAAYIQQSAETLNNATPEDFSPSLALLDATIQSMRYLGD